MREASLNPAKNHLPSSIDEQSLIGAVEMSGYPLQGVVAGKLDKIFGVTEEWGYIDRDTQEHRSLDVFAFKNLSDDRGVKVQPSLALLIECKRTIHPYVFFKRVTDRPLRDFPHVAGLPANRVDLRESSKKRSSYVSPDLILGLNESSFVRSDVPKCASFSKAVPSGKRVDLSGEDPFNKIVLPLVKALDHAAHFYSAASMHPPIVYPTLLLCLCVLDAPMLLIESPDQAKDPILTPWVRVVRQEAASASPIPLSKPGTRFYTVDVVHIDLLDEVVNGHVLPFAEEFSKRAVQLDTVLIEGGEVADLDNWTWKEVKPKG